MRLAGTIYSGRVTILLNAACGDIIADRRRMTSRAPSTRVVPMSNDYLGNAATKVVACY
jgi:hypothetical protein